MFVVGFWWGNLWAGQPGRGVLQGQHSDHAAPAWQLDPMDFRHQREFLLSHRIVKHCDLWLSLPIITSHGSHVTLVLSFLIRRMAATRSRKLLPRKNPQRVSKMYWISRPDASADVGEWPGPLLFLNSDSLSSSIPCCCLPSSHAPVYAMELLLLLLF